MKALKRGDQPVTAVQLIASFKEGYDSTLGDANPYHVNDIPALHYAWRDGALTKAIELNK
jgi:hypothetical protein